MAYLPTDYAGLFKNNYYESPAYADLMHRLLGSLELVHLRNRSLWVYKKTVVSWGHFTKEEQFVLKKKGLTCSSVTLQNNTLHQDPSLIEYACAPASSYNEYIASYLPSFRKRVLYLKKQDLVWYRASRSDADTAREIHENHLQSIGTLKAARTDFREVLKTTGSFLYFVMHKGKPIGFSLGFENEDNLYLSLGGTDPAYRRKGINNFRLDRLFAYAAEHQKNVHGGIGLRGSGADAFKLRAGFTMLRTVTPYNPLSVRLALVCLYFPLRHVLDPLCARFPKMLYRVQIPVT